MFLSNKQKAQAIAAGLSIVSAAANAAPPVFTTLTDSVDYSTAMSAVLLVFAALAGFAILWKGGKKILAALGWS